MNFNYNSSIIVESIVLVKQNRKVTDEKKRNAAKANNLHPKIESFA